MNTLNDNAGRIMEIGLERHRTTKRRVLVAIAGAPGSGKSTLAEHAVALVNRSGSAHAALFPMDGYHYDDAVLEAVGRRPFKGAIDTFDAHGLRHMIQRLKANEEDAVAIPVFDRTIEIARAGGALIPRSIDIVFCEGNYLLSRQEPWNRLAALFDATIFIDVDEPDLRERLRERWRGLGLDDAAINRKVEENDLPNGRAIRASSTEPDFRLDNTALRGQPR